MVFSITIFYIYSLKDKVKVHQNQKNYKPNFQSLINFETYHQIFLGFIGSTVSVCGLLTGFEIFTRLYRFSFKNGYSINSNGLSTGHRVYQFDRGPGSGSKTLYLIHLVYIKSCTTTKFITTTIFNIFS